ncbi:GNAT family N-acetyltransferase [Streptomyces albipurpureus]|uniref:GNAT family N-acetyltransferase n=1 Tax=Streptomyces albipurpureus TaxID=2897419 RepID=A0ABT0UGF7_9ACTN|nr:GNAT family N-acetyltransferase [Streptomyces sp. CWNU-1]MCM2387724.1 GNAT family N-acetyltransferase [Streptomyces sp. CWNU-1]
MSETTWLVRTAHTHEFTPQELAAIHDLLDKAFGGDFGDEDWDHSLGGVHTVLYDSDGAPVAHGSVIMRRVMHGGRSYRVGYVEGVAVRAELRRQGLGDLVMGVLEGVIGRAYDLGALSASDAGAALYRSRDWQLWRGRIEAIGPAGVVHLPDEEDSTFLWAGSAAEKLPEPSKALVFDWRDGDVL